MCYFSTVKLTHDTQRLVLFKGSPSFKTVVSPILGTGELPVQLDCFGTSCCWSKGRHGWELEANVGHGWPPWDGLQQVATRWWARRNRRAPRRASSARRPPARPRRLGRRARTARADRPRSMSTDLRRSSGSLREALWTRREAWLRILGSLCSAPGSSPSCDQRGESPEQGGTNLEHEPRWLENGYSTSVPPSFAQPSVARYMT